MNKQHEYLVIFEQAPTGWGAYPPDLPGCGVAAETRAEAEALIREAIAFHLEGLRLAGLPLPRPQHEAAQICITV